MRNFFKQNKKLKPKPLVKNQDKKSDNSKEDTLKKDSPEPPSEKPKES
jgi:hypothetical protein